MTRTTEELITSIYRKQTDNRKLDKKEEELLEEFVNQNKTESERKGGKN